MSVIKNEDWKIKVKKMQAMWTEKNPCKEYSKSRNTIWVKDETLSSQNVTINAPNGR